MAQPRNPKEFVTIEDMAISSMREIAALVEVLEKLAKALKANVIELLN